MQNLFEFIFLLILTFSFLAMFFPNLKCIGCQQVIGFANQQLQGDLSPTNVSNVVAGLCNIVPSIVRGQVS